MNVETITMPKAEAEQKLRACRRYLHREAEEEYHAVAKGYSALAEGHALLDLTEVMRNCPFDAHWRPRLAIARADRKQVHFEWRSESRYENNKYLTNWTTRGTFSTATSWTPSTARQLRLTVDFGRMPGESVSEGYALVPITPLDLSPRHKLRNRSVLWEVEEWSDKPLRVQPDRDPYLLEHLAGSLYVVVGAWNLTDLERAIMRGRAE